MKKLIYLFLFLLSCENSDSEDKASDYYLRVTFSDFWSGAEEKSYLILSTINGEIIADTSFVGDADFVFEFPESIDDKANLINLTLIKRTKTNDLRDYSLQSYLHLNTGQNLTFRGPGFDFYRSERLKKVSFKNLTNYSRVLVSSVDEYLATSNLPEVISLNTASSPHIFSTINYPDGTKKYLSIGSELNEIELDHNSFKNLNSKEFSKLIFINAISATLFAEIDNQLYRSDELAIGHSTQFNFKFFYPKDLDLNYKQEIKYYLNSQDYLYNVTYGLLNQDELLLQSSFDIINRSPENFQITLYGEVDQIRSDWYATNINNQNQFSFFSWNVYGPHYLTSYSLPKLPIKIKNQLNLDEKSFIFNGAEIKDDEEAKSYQGIIDFKFKRDKAYYKYAKKQRAFRKF